MGLSSRSKKIAVVAVVVSLLVVTAITLIVVFVVIEPSSQPGTTTTTQRPPTPRPTTQRPTTSTDRNELPPALLLTWFIENGRIDEGRELARVVGIADDVESYSGFFTVNRTYDSNLFFWFFPAKNGSETAPVMLWLQGGPGMSSMFGLFVENGPFQLDANLTLTLRDITWANSHSMLYIDNPVGAGFSFTDSGGYSSTQDEIANNLYSALTQFFTLFPTYASNDFYMGGESYAGKYLPNIGVKIHEENIAANRTLINLKGLSLGVPFTDPVSCFQYGNHLYAVGLLGPKERDHFITEEAKAIRAIERELFIPAFLIMDPLLEGASGPSYFVNSTGFDSYYNYLVPASPPDQAYFTEYLIQNAIRTKIHVGNVRFKQYGQVGTSLVGDLYQSALPKLEQLLAVGLYRILVITGQLDIIVPSVALDNVFGKMNWTHQEEFVNSTRQQLKIAGALAGYVREYDILTHYTVLKAGHFPPYDQPAWSYYALNKFTSGESFVTL